MDMNEEGGRTGEAESHSKMQLRKWVEKEWETENKKGEVILRQKAGWLNFARLPLCISLFSGFSCGGIFC